MIKNMNNVPMDVPISDSRKVDLATRPIVMLDPSWIAKIRADKCTGYQCTNSITKEGFEGATELELKELNISGMCLSCQRAFFGEKK